MQKRKIKFPFKYLLLIFIILSCKEEFKRNENLKPEGRYRDTKEIKSGLYCERYLNLDCDCQELFLTDSLKYRLFVMNYNFEYGYHYKFKVDSSKIAFYLIYPKEDNYKLEKISEYTFEELKTKNNLGKGK